jgi:hypothetical protein
MLALPDRDCAIYTGGKWIALSCNPSEANRQQIIESPVFNVQDNFFMVSHGRGSETPTGEY